MRIFFALLFIFNLFTSLAQIPSTCFEIESILVDACVPGGGCVNAGSPACNCEGKNEMVRFVVGPNPLNLSNLTVNWPNNSWQGICQNATTAAHTAALNSTIQACGLLIEPTGGILPAGAKVIFITSTDFCTVGNSFANLADTMYIIFQCPGNFAGHFANFGTGLRTLTMSFGAGCSDTVTYDRALLVNQSGIPSASNADGSTVNFTWNGTASYVNYGCQAPIVPLTANAFNLTLAPYCVGDTLTLTGSLTGGNASSYLWSGGNGLFLQNNNDTVQYIVGINDVGTFNLFFTAFTCNDSIRDTLQITIQNSITGNISVTPNDTICIGQTATITASGGTSYAWNTGAQTASINVTSPGTYTVIISGACGSVSLSQQIFAQNSLTGNISVSPNDTICQGQTATITASGGTSYAWNTGAQTASINVTTPGLYTVIIADSCGTDTLSMQIVVNPLPSPIITVNGNTSICQGDSVMLTASGGNSYVWSNGSTSPSIYVSTAGNYTVTATNNCGSVTSTPVSISVNPLPNVTINASQSSICGNQTATLTANGANSYAWNTGSNANAITITTAGTYTVIGTNNCGNDTASITITQDTPPIANITNTGRDTICKGETTTLTASGIGNFIWNGNTTVSTTFTVTNAGNYYVVATNACGSDTAYYTIYLNSISAAFTPNPPNGQIPLTVTFNNSSINATSFNWNLGDNASSTETNPVYTYQNPGEYTVTLIAENNYGCKDTATYEFIKVDDYLMIFIPNVFTPNEDNINDTFQIKGVRVKDIYCRIYNRWGEEIYAWQGLDGKWDGTHKNEKVSDGVYFYLLDIEWMNGTKDVKSGHITLIH